MDSLTKTGKSGTVRKRTGCQSCRARRRKVRFPLVYKMILSMRSEALENNHIHAKHGNAAENVTSLTPSVDVST